MASYSEDKAFLVEKSDDLAAGMQRRSQGRYSCLSHASVIVTVSAVWCVIILIFISSKTQVVPPGSRSLHELPRTNAPDMPIEFPLHNYGSGPPGPNITTTRRVLQCGNTTVEARARGCLFDLSLGSWVPEPCFDQEAVDDYVNDGTNTPYADPELTQVLTYDEMIERDFYWSSFRDHLNHCVVGWRRATRAMFYERAGLDAVMVSPAHTVHCSELMFNTAIGVQPWLSTKTEKSYLECWVRG